MRAGARGTRPCLIGSPFSSRVGGASGLRTSSSGGLFAAPPRPVRFMRVVSSNVKLILPSPNCGPGFHLQIFLFQPVILSDFWKCRLALRVFFFGRSLIEALCARDHTLKRDFWQATLQSNHIAPAPCPYASLNLYQTRPYSSQSRHFHRLASFLASF